MKLPAWLVLLLTLTACSEPPELAPAAPLTTPAATLAQLPGYATGRHAAATAALQTITTPDGRKVDVRLSYPQTGSALPLLLFSHGNWSDYAQYDNIINHWVSHGYVVLAPYHLDAGGMARGIFNSLRYGQLGLIKARSTDLSAVLDQAPQLLAAVPGLAARTDLQRVAATGHSFGAYSAQMLGGAAAIDPDTGEKHFTRDPRIQAIVAVSPPGEMFDTITSDSWSELNVSQLVSTGTWDVNASFWPDWQAHLLSYNGAMPGHNYALVLQGVDHYFGNLICRLEREQTPQQDGLNLLNAVSTAFLDANLKQSAAAQAWLDSDQLAQLSQGFATLQRR